MRKGERNMGRDANELNVLLTKDLMEYMHIGKEKAYALMRSKSFPSSKIGKTYFVTMVNLQQWLNENVGKTINV
jgi:hypothetical protein